MSDIICERAETSRKREVDIKQSVKKKELFPYKLRTESTLIIPREPKIFALIVYPRIPIENQGQVSATDFDIPGVCFACA